MNAPKAPFLPEISTGPLISESASQLLSLPSDTSRGSGLSPPMTPTSPNPRSPSETKAKRANPLTDLVETEKIFVDNLTGIIRKVAAAWSRSNLPPAELDTMFRSIEGVYKANRSLHTKLKDINADPKSAGELGGLLIKWIDDLKKPYETYCNKFCTGFDTWQPVQSNARLGPILEQFSESNPPSNGGVWTLDSLFLLPKLRLKYYLKLYNRLLKNTDNKLLVGAVEALNRLLEILESRSEISVAAKSPPALELEDEVVIDMRNQLSPPGPPKSLRPQEEGITGSETSSNHGSSVSGQRSSRESEATNQSRASTQTIHMPISDLERRLLTDRTLDIFTMTPKAVKLQMSPPTLTFTRELRVSSDVVIRVTPRATGVEKVHVEGHIFLMSDLFLVCERMTPEERSQQGKDADMWLCYPPLSGKVLRVSEVEGNDNVLQVAIMRKEFLFLETPSREQRNILINHFKDCVDFAGSLPPPSKQPPPPVPPLPSKGTPPPGHTPELARSPNGPPMHPIGGIMSPPGGPFPPGPRGPYPPQHPGPHNLPPDAPPHGQPPHFRPSASAQPFPPARDPAFGPGPGPAIPQARSAGFMPGQPPFSGQQRPPFPPGPGPHGPGFQPPPRPPSEPRNGVGLGISIHRSPSTPSLHNPGPQQPPPGSMPPGGPGRGYPPQMQMGPGGMGPGGPGPVGPMGRGPPPNGPGGLQVPGGGGLRPLLPSAAQARVVSMADPGFREDSPPNSPEQPPQQLGPVTSTVSAQMKCKVFLQQQHAQWKSLGSAKLKLYRQEPTNIKQLVVEADNKEKSVLISTIVLTDGVERVGKTGVAIELSDQGSRTGIVYMIQLRNEQSAGGLFDSLLAGSDRSGR